MAFIRKHIGFLYNSAINWLKPLNYKNRLHDLPYLWYTSIKGYYAFKISEQTG